MTEAQACEIVRRRDEMLSDCDELATRMHATGRTAEAEFFERLRSQIEELPTMQEAVTVANAMTET